MKRAIPAAILLTLVISGMASALTSWASGVVNSDAEMTLKNLVYAEHDRYCAPPIQDSRLINAARYKAQDMAYRSYFAHAFLDGKHIWDFYARAGIRYTAAAEIMAWNNYPDDLSPNAAFQQFMGSTDHRNTIRSCTYTYFGVAAFKIASGAKYYVVEFRRS